MMNLDKGLSSDELGKGISSDELGKGICSDELSKGISSDELDKAISSDELGKGISSDELGKGLSSDELFRIKRVVKARGLGCTKILSLDSKSATTLHSTSVSHDPVTSTRPQHTRDTPNIPSPK